MVDDVNKAVRFPDEWGAKYMLAALSRVDGKDPLWPFKALDYWGYAVKEHIFDYTPRGVMELDPAQAFTKAGERRWSRVLKAMQEPMERAVRAFDTGTADDYGKACIAFDDALSAELDRVSAAGVGAADAQAISPKPPVVKHARGSDADF
jgi:hypothetical protein